MTTPKQAAINLRTWIGEGLKNQPKNPILQDIKVLVEHAENS